MNQSWNPGENTTRRKTAAAKSTTDCKMLNLQHNGGIVRDNLEKNTAEILNRVPVVFRTKLCCSISGHCHVITSSEGNDMCLPILNIIKWLYLIHQSISGVHSTILLNHTGSYLTLPWPSCIITSINFGGTKYIGPVPLTYTTLTCQNMDLCYTPKSSKSEREYYLGVYWIKFIMDKWWTCQWLYGQMVYPHFHKYDIRFYKENIHFWLWPITVSLWLMTISLWMTTINNYYRPKTTNMKQYNIFSGPKIK